jgi:hypothetical protein
MHSLRPASDDLVASHRLIPWLTSSNGISGSPRFWHVYSHFFRVASQLECTINNSWTEQVAPGSNTGLWTRCPRSGERRILDHPHSIRAME